MHFRLFFAAAILAFTFTVHAQDPATFEVSSLKFQRPTDWQWVPVTSPMRKAQLKVPGADPDKAAEITFFHFGGGQGGDVQANAQRWLGQFKSTAGAEKIEPLEVPDAKVTLVSTEGTFSSGMPGGPAKAMEDYALLGAIVEGADGPVFIKMTGPSATVKAARQKFIDFVSAAAKK
jgi:hypothetical protein